jgi:hypothetical protein
MKKRKLEVEYIESVRQDMQRGYSSSNAQSTPREPQCTTLATTEKGAGSKDGEINGEKCKIRKNCRWPGYVAKCIHLVCIKRTIVI